ncbi:hypothetical protein LNV09_15585 [Paucibacter sp. B2R-40]|uniref:hypothetical protein n=1 Tax=Paucibacter sp. B2R-40 TaxID=2893554 RepID=UPI0021E44ACC|nr:hypothetical protein [Paucibacter sp. B2R-40]MCV2355567.1 hypothetical protein [Paucibacter sp. B2R-40]
MIPPEHIVKLADAAELKLAESFNASDVLPFADAAISIIKAHPHLQAEFEAVFLELPGRAPVEFIEVCMHALGWPNIKHEYESRCHTAIARNDWNAERVYRHCLEAFEPDWEDARDFYASYFLHQDP